MQKDKKKILFLCADRGIPFGGTKGASIHVREFLDALHKADFAPQVAVTRLDQSKAYTPDCPVYLLPDNGSLPFLDLNEELEEDKQLLKEAKDYYRNQAMEQTITNIYRNSSFDLIYERYSLFSTAGLVFAQSKKIPFVLEVNAPLVLEASKYRNLNQMALAKSVEKFLFSNADHIITVSKQLKQYVQGVVAKAKVSVIPNGVSLESYTDNKINSWRSTLSENLDEDYLIGFVGSIKPWHGVEILIEAFSELRKTDKSFRLCIVGNGDDKYENKLYKLCQALEIDDLVTFTGAVPFEEIPGILKSMDVLVAPYPNLSNFYFSPLKIFEYMAAGKPIVASSIGQIADLLTDEKNALLVTPGKCQDLVTAINRLKEKPELAKELGDKAFAEANSKHTWHQRISEIKKIFMQVGSNYRHPDGVSHADKI